MLSLLLLLLLLLVLFMVEAWNVETWDVKSSCFAQRGQPKAASFIWVPPWVRVRIFGLSGQVLHIFITVMCDFAYGFPHGYMPEPIELPLGTIDIDDIRCTSWAPGIVARATLSAIIALAQPLI